MAKRYLRGSNGGKMSQREAKQRRLVREAVNSRWMETVEIQPVAAPSSSFGLWVVIAFMVLAGLVVFYANS